MPDINLHWQIDHLRLTAFPAAPLLVEDVSWWADVVGEQSDSRTVQPKAGTMDESGTSSLFGEGAVVSLHVEPLRIDWRLAPARDEPLNGWATCGDFPEALDDFVALGAKWLGAFEVPVARLAFGAVLVCPIQTQIEGYQRLGTFLPFAMPEGASDFLYQINRPRPSNVVDGLMVNRLTKWSVGKLMMVQMPMGGSPMVTTPSRDQFVCRLELDVNTSPQSAAGLEAGTLSQVFRELSEFAREISEKGDVQ